MADTAPWEDFSGKPAAPAAEPGPWEEFKSGPKMPALSGPDLSPEALAADNKNRLWADIKKGAQKQVNNAVGLVDMVVGVPGQLIGVGTDIGGRISALAQGGSRSDAEWAGKSMTQDVAIQKLSAPVMSFMQGLGWGDDANESDLANVMGGLQKAIERGGEWVNEKTGGKLTQADTVSLMNTLMASLGGRGVAVLQPKIDAMGKVKPGPVQEPNQPGQQTPQADAFAAKTANRLPAPEAPRTPEAFTAWSRKFSDEPLATQDAMRNAEIKAYNLVQSGASKATVDRIVKREPLVGEALALIRERRGMVAESSLGTIEQSPALDPKPPAQEPRIGVDPIVPPTQAPPATDLATRAGNLSRAQQAIVDDAKKRFPPDTRLLPAALAATGLGLAYQFGGDNEDLAAAAIGGGAILAGRGKGLKLEEVKALPDATPLGAIRDQLGYTLLTLERLPGGRGMIDRRLIEEQLKRQDVTAAEKGLFEEVLKEIKGDSIPAKELVATIKSFADDWELQKKDSGQWADYGLEAIDRTVAPEVANWVPDSWSADLVDGNYIVRDADSTVIASIPDRGQGIERAMEEGANQYTQESFANAPQATTSIWRLPNLQLGTNNHFGDPNYFGHTRSFMEDRIRHVVELQSDLAQRTRSLTPEERISLEGSVKAGEQQKLWAEMVTEKLGNPGLSAVTKQNAIRRYFEQVEVSHGVGLDKQLTIGSFAATVLEDVAKLDYSRTAEALAARAKEILAKARDEKHNHVQPDQVLEELIKDLGSKDPRIEDFANDLLLRAFFEERTKTGLWLTEKASRLQEGGNPTATPLLKNWHKRLVREELADAAKGRVNPEYAMLRDQIKNRMRQMPEEARTQNPEIVLLGQKLLDTPERLPPEKVVRFATADTVAKVEGWPRLDRAERGMMEMLADRQTGRTDAAVRAQDANPRFRPEHQGIYDRYKGDVEKFLKQLGGKPVTDSAGHTWIEVPVDGSKQLPAGARTQMFGRVEPELMAYLAAVGGSAVLAAALSDPGEKGMHAGLAALVAGVAGLTVLSRSKSAGLADIAKQGLDTAEYFLGNLSYQLEKLSPPILRAQRNFERLLLTSTHDRLQRVAQWTEGLRAVPAGLQPALSALILTGDRTKVVDFLKANGLNTLIPHFNEVAKVLGEVGQELKGMKLLKGLVQDYYPRIVSDYPGLMKALGEEARQFVEAKLAAAERKSQARNGTSLTELERSAILNQALQDSIFARGGEGRRFLMGRKIEEVTAELSQFYESPADSLPMYLRAATNAIEKARYFGKHLVADPVTGKIDNNASIGNIVNEQVKNGKLTEEGRLEVTKLLEARFGGGEQTANRAMRALQNFTTATLVGNPATALLNVADTGTIAAMHGVLPTIKGIVASILRRDGRITNAAIGLANGVAEEFTGALAKPVTVMGRQLSLARFLDGMMKWSGFKALDSVMKESALNAAEISARQQLRTAKGEARFVRNNAEYFGDDVSALVSDLRAGERSQLVYEYVFKQISDAQPVSKIEVPQGYLANPNMRFMWQLKSFMLKQFTLLRQRGIDQIRAGNVAEGTKFLLRYTLMVGAAGASMDLIVKALLGRDHEADWKDVPLNAMKNFGLSQYVMDKAAQGKLKEAALAFGSPAVTSILDIASAKPESVARIPIFGRLIYERGMGGAEKANMREDAKKEKQAREDAMTDEDKEARQEKKEVREQAKREKFREKRGEQ